MAELLVVREARPEDDARIGELLVEAFVSTYARKMPEVQVTEERKGELRNVAEKRSQAAVFVAEIEGRVVGTIAVYPPTSARSEAWRPNSADIRHLAIDPGLQGQGISRPLMDRAEQRARQWGVSQICLHVRRGAHGIARMYQSLGYERDAAGDLEYPSVYLEAFFKPLEGIVPVKTDMSSSDRPLCLAPFTSCVIDPNKGVRPCCTFEGPKPGNLNIHLLDEVMRSQAWTELKRKLSKHEWPRSCLNCKDREAQTGWSVRSEFQDDDRGFPIRGWREGKLTYLEFAGSNLCNLACLHCNLRFSSKWKPDLEKLLTHFPEYPDNGCYGDFEPSHPDAALVLKSLERLDLENLRTVNLKGGEPFLSAEIEAILQHLSDRGVLENINISVSTNGTVRNGRLLGLLAKARQVRLHVSIDGIGRLNSYIRHGRSHTDLIRKNIRLFNDLENIIIERTTSILPYNISRLLEIREWWLEVAEENKRASPRSLFNLVVLMPAWQSPCVLSEGFRKRVCLNLEKHQLWDEFETTIRVLQSPYLGDAEHDRWVRYTETMQEIRKNDILELVPELEPEFVMLTG